MKHQIKKYINRFFSTLKDNQALSQLDINTILRKKNNDNSKILYR